MIGHFRGLKPMYAGVFDKKTFVPALIGAGVCLFLLRGGFLSFFFLIPLGFLIFRYDYRTACTAFVIILAGRILLTVIASAARGIPPAGMIWDLLYFSLMALVFIWISSPPPFLSFGMPGSVRFIAGSGLAALLFTAIFLRAAASLEFLDEINLMINALMSLIRSSGSDVVRDALLENISPETVLDMMKAVMLRGGGLVSCMFIFFISRQISLTLARLSRRERGSAVFNAFHVYPAIIWVLSASLLLVVLASLAKLEIPEIILWNVLVLCVILYLAQGLGIMQFFLSKASTPPFLRMLLIVLFIVLLFSPALNTVLFAGLVLLGIAENWVPFRASKSNEPPSTPEAGDGGN